MPRLKYYAGARPGDKYWTILERPHDKRLAVGYNYFNIKLIVDALNFHEKHLREKAKTSKKK